MAMEAPSATPERRRHAAAGAAEWAAVSGSGAWRVEEVGKQQLRRQTGLPARDLRALDPSLPYAAPIVAGRDRTVVVSLESVRAVITASEVVVPCPQDRTAAPLVRELLARLGSTAPTTTAASRPPQLSDGAAEKDGSVSPQSRIGGGGQDDGNALGSGMLLPFEFRALEVCLEVAFKSLEHESSTLEKEAYPALDELSSKVSTLNLERVRQIKSRLVAISGRVQKVREELEHLLDDDMDMAAMHLSEKLAYRSVGQSSRFGTEEEASESDDERDDEIKEHEGSEGGNDNGTSIGFPLRINELEGLLEAFFVRIDGALNKLSTLREYVDDTEDYINIMLDDKHNQLLQMGVLLSTATLVITCGILVTGVLAMNIHIPLYEAPAAVFWQTTAGLVGGMVALFVVALLYYRKTGILR